MLLKLLRKSYQSREQDGSKIEPYPKIFRALICDFNSPVYDFVIENLKDVLGQQYELQAKKVFYGEELIYYAKNEPVDLFVVLFEKMDFFEGFSGSDGPQKKVEMTRKLITTLRRQYEKPVIVLSCIRQYSSFVDLTYPFNKDAFQELLKLSIKNRLN